MCLSLPLKKATTPAPYGVIWLPSNPLDLLRCYNLTRCYSPRQLEAQAKTGKPQLARDAMTMEVGGLVEVMSWVMGFGRHAWVLEPAHLRQAMTEELVATVERYAEQSMPIYQEEAEQRKF